MNLRIILIIMPLVLLFLKDTAMAQWLDPEWKKTIVQFEVQADTTFVAVGTGFVVTYSGREFIVTAKHISDRARLFVRFNRKSETDPSFRFPIDGIISLTGLPWGKADEADVAVLLLAVPLVVSPTSVTNRDSLDLKSIGISLFRDWDYINEADEVYVLGFPLRIGSGDRYSPVIRSGIVALKTDRGRFLIDSNIFPGNSGGPVFLKSYIYDYRSRSLGSGTTAYLIGVVSHYISYKEVAVSAQTQRPRITFEENSGLAGVVSSEEIVNLLDQYVETHWP